MLGSQVVLREMSKRLGGRLDPYNPSITLLTIERAAMTLGKRCGWNWRPEFEVEIKCARPAPDDLAGINNRDRHKFG